MRRARWGQEGDWAYRLPILFRPPPHRGSVGVAWVNGAQATLEHTVRLIEKGVLT